MIAGFLQSANVIGRVPTAPLWGLYADRRGLRRALCATLCGLALGGVLFAVCTDSAAESIAVRFVFLGLSNGWTAVQAACGGALDRD